MGTLKKKIRPRQAILFCGLLTVFGLFMIYLGTMAWGFYVAAAPLFLAGLLLWTGRLGAVLETLLALNLATALVLVLDLWLGDALHLPKLDISGAMLIANVVLGGPAMGLLAVPLLALLAFRTPLRAWLLAAIAACSILRPVTAEAAILTGTLRIEGGLPVAGAMLSVWNEDKTRKETVYSGADGSYAIKTDFGGKLAVRARLANFADATAEMQVGANEAQTLDLTMPHFASPEALSEALTASAHTAVLPWKDGQERAPFVSQCNYCHQVGNALTRVPRPLSEWRAAVDRMQGYFAMLSAKEADTVVDTLHKGFDGAPVKAMLDYGAAPELTHAKVEQWLVGDPGSFIHDTDVGADDKLYGTDEGNDILWVLDRKSGGIDRYPLPKTDLPRGGKFAGMALPIGIFTGQHGPHSMAETKDGRLWITNALSSSLTSFDTATKEMKLYPLSEDTLYPHTIRVDGEGTLWFTINASNQVGRFDPKTGTSEILSLPSHTPWRWISDVMLPTVFHAAAWFPEKNLPLAISHHKFFGHTAVASAYGIDVDPLDGSIWVMQLYDNFIIRIDPKTHEMTSYPTPHGGPRRGRFDKNGILWIPSFDEGILMRFDPRDARWQSYELPVLAADEYEVPYALAVHPVTQDIWITANASDRILRFIPAEKRFISYPSPSRVTVLRDLVFTRDGRVCNSISNLPAYGTEDGLDSFTCFDPEGDDKDRAAIAAAKTK